MNKCYIENLETLKKLYKEIGHEQFVNRYIKVDVFIGDSDSIDFVNEKLKTCK